MNDIESQSLVAYLGPAGTYSHGALLKFFGSAQACLPVAEIPDVFTSVELGESIYGLVPVENSTQGSITATLDRFSTSNLTVLGEVMLRIQHCLLVTDKGIEINKVVSHQQSLGQCRNWLKKHYPAVEKSSVSSNAEAAKIAAEGKGIAAIAGETAANLYNLQVLAKNIEDIHDNTTRFWVLGRNHQTQSTGNDKTSIIISTHNEAGALFKALEPFQRYDISLSKVESRPSRKEAWSYSFYVDFEGHVDDSQVQAVLAQLKENALGVKILGSYPAASV